MAELLQGKKAIDRDFETTIEESEKRIKLLLRPGEMKARFEHFRKEAESKLPPLPPQKPMESTPFITRRILGVHARISQETFCQ